MKPKDIVEGTVIGNFTFIKKIGYIKTKASSKLFWECECICGTVKTYQVENILRGSSKTCGCSRNNRTATYSKPFGLANANHLYTNYKNGAKRRNYIFDITFEEFLQYTSMNCYFCGSPPNQICEVKHSKGPKSGTPRCNGPYIYNGLDRLDNTLGYTKNNIVPCCGSCNFAKYEKTYEEFISWIKIINDRIIKGFVNETLPTCSE